VPPVSQGLSVEVVESRRTDAAPLRENKSGNRW
jgi:hypothetical protein